jgi:hypothetical protein
MLSINHNTCLSIKNKKTIIQCPHKRKNGQLFCGIHLKASNVIRVDTLPEYMVIDKKKIINDNNIIINENKIIDENFYTKDFLLKNSINKIKVGKLRNTIKHFNLMKLIGKNKSKRILFNEIINYLNR